MSKQHVTRRDFLRTTARAAAGVAIAPAVYKSILPQSIVGANERIRTAHIGTGGMGMANLQLALGNGSFQPIAICDLWPPHRERAVTLVEEAGQPKPSAHVYFEEVIENRDVDAVVISTPDHWHALPAIMACEAGKDVWCEKPLGTTVAEGRAMVDAARRHDTVFQCGTMQRSGEHFQEAVQLVQSGYIGKVSRVATWINWTSPIEGFGRRTGEDPPPDLDWERYIGWTPMVPFDWNRFIHNFRYFLEYSGGWTTDWGVHLLDIGLWAMGEDKPVRKVTASGGKYVLTDNSTTPDQLDVLYEFDDYVLSFSHRTCNSYPSYGGGGHGIIFFGTAGTLRVDRGGYEVTPNEANGGCEPRRRGGSPMNEPHWVNFAECIRARKRPICDVAVCHNTSTVCHMGTCAYVTGTKLQWDPEKEKFDGPERKSVRKANDFAYREYQNGWSLEAPHYKGWT